MSCVEHYCVRFIEEFNQDFKETYARRLKSHALGMYDSLQIRNGTVMFRLSIDDNFFYSESIFDPNKKTEENAVYVAMLIMKDYDDVFKRLEAALDA